MLTELKCGKTHVQFFIEGNCIGTVRVEYAEAVKAAIEAQIAEGQKAVESHAE